MSRSFVKLVGVLLVVGILPFAASLVIVNDLFSQAVSVGLNPEVQAHLLASAEAHRQFFEAEKTAHELAADRVAADPRWMSARRDAQSAEEASLGALLSEYDGVHPHLVRLAVEGPAGSDPVTLVVAEPADSEVIRDEERTIMTADGPATLRLTFSIPSRYVVELEALGETLGTFRALESLEGELSRGMRKTYLYFSGGVAILALLIGALLTRRTTRRIERIAAAAGRVGAGDLSVRLGERGGDEIGALAREFDRMVEELADSQERVAYLQRVSAWQEMARRLAHEIKNPLTPILLAMQQLDRKFDQLRDAPDRFRPLLSEALEIVEEEVGTLRALVKEFSDLARLPSVSPKATRVAAFIEDFVKTNPQLTQRADIRIEIATGLEDAVAELDPILMRRALVNVVENAIEATAEARPPTITLSVRRDGDRILIRADDEGPGVSPEDLERVFDPYFTTKEHGTGLGLPIVRKIVLDHGGWVRLENRPQGGCRMTLSFPQLKLAHRGELG